MAIDRGALLAQTYQLPQAQPPVQAPRETPYQDDIGDPAAGLQHIDGVTSEYFQKWAALKGFARDVQENLGIDVRYPDPSIPGSDRLHRIYLKSIADLKAQGERLKTGQQMFMADRQRGANISGDPRKQYYDELQVGTDIVDTDLDPIVAEANKKLQGPHFGSAINEAKAYKEQVKQMLAQRIKNDPQNAGYWQRQLDSLIEPIQAVQQFNPNTGGYTSYQQGRIKGADAFLRKMLNLRMGTADSYKLSDNIFGPNGERVLVSEDTKGDMWGGGQVVRHEFYPSTKQSFKIIKDKDGKTKRIDVTNIDDMTHAKGYVSDNTRYAATGEYLDIAADEMGYLDPNTGEINYKNLLAPDAEKRFADMEKMVSDPEALKVVKAKEKLRSVLDSLEPGIVWDDTKKLKIKGGKTIKIEANPDGVGGKSYAITNWKDINPNASQEEKNYVKKLSLDDLEKFLMTLDAHLLLDESGTKSAPTSTSADPLGKVVPSLDPAAEAKKLLEQYRNQKK